jgi:hypothetical protein
MNNGCDLATNIPDLFNNIMNDYVNMKQPSLYGLSSNFDGEKSMEDLINTGFAQPYFNVDICNNTTRPYDQTCRTMK